MPTSVKITVLLMLTGILLYHYYSSKKYPKDFHLQVLLDNELLGSDSLNCAALNDTGVTTVIAEQLTNCRYDQYSKLGPLSDYKWFWNNKPSRSQHVHLSVSVNTVSKTIIVE